MKNIDKLRKYADDTKALIEVNINTYSDFTINIIENDFTMRLNAETFDEALQKAVDYLKI